MFIQQDYKFTENYDITDNYLNNIRVKPTAKSIYRFMASRPPKWRFRVSYLSKMECISSKTVYKYLNQLIQLGLITRHQTKTDDGKFGESIYTVIKDIKGHFKRMDEFKNEIAGELQLFGYQGVNYSKDILKVIFQIKEQAVNMTSFFIKSPCGTFWNAEKYHNIYSIDSLDNTEKLRVNRVGNHSNNINIYNNTVTKDQKNLNLKIGKNRKVKKHKEVINEILTTQQENIQPPSLHRKNINETDGSAFFSLDNDFEVTNNACKHDKVDPIELIKNDDLNNHPHKSIQLNTLKKERKSSAKKKERKDGAVDSSKTHINGKIKAKQSERVKVYKEAETMLRIHKKMGILYKDLRLAYPKIQKKRNNEGENKIAFIDVYNEFNGNLDFVKQAIDLYYGKCKKNKTSQKYIKSFNNFLTHRCWEHEDFSYYIETEQDSIDRYNEAVASFSENNLINDNKGLAPEGFMWSEIQGKYIEAEVPF